MKGYPVLPFIEVNKQPLGQWFILFGTTQKYI